MDPFEVHEIAGKGKGLVATRTIESGDIILEDRPLVASQTPSSRLEVLACGNSCCLRPAQDNDLQTQFQLGHCPREQVMRHILTALAAAAALVGYFCTISLECNPCCASLSHLSLPAGAGVGTRGPAAGSVVRCGLWRVLL